MTGNDSQAGAGPAASLLVGKSIPAALRPCRRRLACSTRSVLAAAAWAAAWLALPSTAAAQDDAVPKLFAPSLTYDGALVDDVHGGARRGAAYVGNLNLKLAADGSALGAPGFSAYLDLLTIHGGLSDDSRVGDAQGVSNLAGPSGTQFEELWFEYSLKDRAASVLVGLYDLNSEFYKLRAAGLFLAAPFGIGTDFAQSGANGPSIFPRTSVGVRLAVKPTAGSVLRMAILDGVPVVRDDGSRSLFKGGDGVLLVTELALLSHPDPGPPGPSHARNRIGRLSTLPAYEDKLALGIWHYTARFDDLADTDAAGDPIRRHGSSGAYLAGERLLLGSVDSARHRLSAFVQAGVADPRVNRFGSYVGAGVVATGWAGWTGAGDSDEIGVSLARSRNGSHALRGLQASTGVPARRTETIVELTWLAAFGDHLTLQPALQRVQHPDTDPRIANAWVAQLRLEIGY